jgi:hypothetical protein
MRCVTYDAVELKPGINSYSFFNDSDDVNGERVNSIAESELVKWIFNNPYTIGNIDYLLYQELQLNKSNYQPYLEVTKPIIKDNDEPGDIDILLIDDKNPQLSIGIQAKRIKCTIDENNVANLKTSHILRGIKQAKKMYQKYRFYQNYLMLIVVADSQSRKNNFQIFRYPSLQEKQVVYTHSGFGDLPEEVGIFIYEVNQPSANHINFTGLLASKALRLAKPVEQLTDTTNRIQQLKLFTNGT